MTTRSDRARVALVFGTRPEAIKMAPIAQAMRADDLLEPLIVVTGQHREMLDQVLDVFDLAPDVDLDILRPRQSLTDITTSALTGLTATFAHDRPDAVVVQGDTTTTMAAALAAFYTRIPVVHVEAGLRTNDRYSPFPEEINRRLTTQLTDLHLAPTPTALAALLTEGVQRDRIVVTGNTVIDALLWTVKRPPAYTDPRLEKIDAGDARVVLVTTHRRESWGAPMENVANAIADLGRAYSDVQFVIPMHRNPVVREAIEPRLGHLPNVTLTEPLPYPEFVRMMNRAHVLLSDSGGVQEEGPSLGKPVLVMRDTTERPEAVEAGTARLVGTDAEAITGWVTKLLCDQQAYAAMANAVNPYGDGAAADRSIVALKQLLGFTTVPVEEFEPGRPTASSSARS